MSASRSAASTRSVTSSRLPIGVGQTISRPPLTRSRSLTVAPREPVEGERRGADHPGLDAEPGRDDPHRVARGRQHAP